MHISALILPLLSLTALAKEHHGGRNSTSAQCKEFFKDQKLVALAANATLLAEVTKNNATKADAIKKKAAAVQPKIDADMANTKLMSTCSMIQAKEKENAECGFMHRMDKLQKLVANQTALNDLTKNNATKADKIKAKVQADMPKLAELQKNTTLLQFCAAKTTMAECREMKKLNKLVSLSKNETELTKMFKGNTTKIDAFKAKITKKEAKLNTMMNNSTLMGICGQMKDGKDGKDGKGGKSNSQNGVKSGASGVRTVGTLSVAAVVAVVAGLMM